MWTDDRTTGSHRGRRPLVGNRSSGEISSLRSIDQRPKREIACSIKGDVKNIFLPPPEARIWFAASSPYQL
jgi:hypothetical protein